MVAAVLSAPGAAGNSAGFSDETAEGSVGPDIARVEVSNDDAGNVTFRILLANGASLAANQGIWLSLDTDENPATGGYIMGVGRGGFDYALDTGRPVAPRLCTRMQEVGGTFGGFMALDPGSLRCSYPAPGVVVFQINRSDLGASNGVNLVAVGEVYDAAQSRSFFGDQAPGCAVTWNYKLHDAPSAPAPASTALASEHDDRAVADQNVRARLGPGQDPDCRPDRDGVKASRRARSGEVDERPRGSYVVILELGAYPGVENHEASVGEKGDRSCDGREGRNAEIPRQGEAGAEAHGPQGHRKATLQVGILWKVRAASRLARADTGEMKLF